MSVRYFGFVLLLWFPGLQHAQSATEPCRAPSLSGGYFVPEKEIYLHESKVTYACDKGLKPAVEGWWATSTCKNAKWSHDPQCINETSCLPPTIPNAHFDVHPKGWYEDRSKIRIKCDEGYEHKGRHATALCENGSWSSLLVCERSLESCSEPLKMPHAVIINKKSQEVFAANSELLYECEDGFTTEGTEEKKIYCIYGNWTEGRPCIRKPTPGPGQGGSTERGAGGRHTASTRNDYDCVFDPEPHRSQNIAQTGIKYLKEGETLEHPCIWPDFRSVIKCTNGQYSYTECCPRDTPSDRC